jgi:transcriptional regulator with XRE-family HTH domain
MCKTDTPIRYDFSPIGSAIKAVRESRGMSRETVAELCDVSPGYIKAIENTGKNPGFQVFYRLMTMFGISVDEFFYPEAAPDTSSEIRQIVTLLREGEVDDIYYVRSTLESLSKNRRRNSDR